MKKAIGQPTIPLALYVRAVEDLKRELDAPTRADVWDELENRLKGKTHQELVAMLDKRTEPKVYQREKSSARGTLRILFVWGSGCLWFIGAFVKNNDKEGERLARRILPRADIVRDLDQHGKRKKNDAR